jgi:hypothetical protein
MLKTEEEAKKNMKSNPEGSDLTLSGSLSIQLISATNRQCADGHFLRTSGPHFPASQDHIKRPVLRDQQSEEIILPY